MRRVSMVTSVTGAVLALTPMVGRNPDYGFLPQTPQTLLLMGVFALVGCLLMMVGTLLGARVRTAPQTTSIWRVCYLTLLLLGLECGVMGDIAVYRYLMLPA